MSFENSRARGRITVAALSALTLTAGFTVSGAGAAHAAADTVSVNFATSTGAVYGQAAGALYGISDDGVPSYPVVAGVRPRSMTVKPPNGAQHPGADPLVVAKEFFATGGGLVLVNTQDAYPDFPYNGSNRPTDFSTYLAKVTDAVTAIKAADPTHFTSYVFVPFNEPDAGEWYTNYTTATRDQFLADWDSAYQAIKAVDSRAKVGGIGLYQYNHTRLNDFIAYAKAHNELPDVLTWHELQRSDLGTFRGHLDDYRAIETANSVSAIPVNITEWGDRSDMSVPGQLIQWLTMLEDKKVAGNSAYWTYAGNLNDNTTQSNQANGGWWLQKWYADLTGNTVQVTPPKVNTPQTVQGLASVDTAKRQATVLLGGGANDITLSLANLPSATFGTSVDVRVSRDTWSGYEGDQQQPTIMAAQRVSLTSGSTTVTIPNTDPQSAYQVVITPAAGTAPVATAPWSSSVEAEKATLTDVTAAAQDTDADAQKYAASGKAVVQGFTKASSALTWNVTVPTTGTYRLSSIAGTNGVAGQQALFVDSTFNQVIQYTADLQLLYSGKTDVVVNLTAGTHALSVRASKDAVNLLPGANISVDKLEFTRVIGAETSTYPARFARTTGAATYVFGSGTTGALLQVGPSATGQFFVSAADNGYYDLALRYTAPSGATPVTLTVNGRPVTGLGSSGAGTFTGTARVHLARGVSEVDVTSTGTLQLDTLTLTRATAGDSSTRTIEAESGTLAGAARKQTIAASTGSNVSGGADVGYLGNGSANTLTLARPSGLAAGAYDIGVTYANADKYTANHYNVDVISRGMTISETGGASATASYRHNYSWSSFWTQTVPLNLSTSSGNLVLGSTTGYAPDVDKVTISPLVLSTAVAAS